MACMRPIGVLPLVQTILKASDQNARISRDKVKLSHYTKNNAADFVIFV